jgi:hypothetical protein
MIGTLDRIFVGVLKRVRQVLEQPHVFPLAMDC